MDRRDGKAAVCCTERSFWPNLILFKKSELYTNNQAAISTCEGLIESNKGKLKVPMLSVPAVQKEFMAMCVWVHAVEENWQVNLLKPAVKSDSSYEFKISGRSIYYA